ncbi:MAG: lytic transglycosylase domain-containing protein [Proteobacteria bacterium]|nr:lytic transglycosylase domain-containing protein [Pseudomonadota bacterium]
MKAIETLQRLQRSTARSLGGLLRGVGHALLEISHNTLALLGLAVVALALVAGRADVRQQVEARALEWLQGRHEARALESGDLLAVVADQTGVDRATATDPRQLSRQQAAVTQWIARRYRVAPEPIARLVQEAWTIGRRATIDPTLILAIMAIESSFNPFAQSSVGAQGLMQVMTRVHDEKYEAFGGTHAAFDPVSNLRVGVQVLKDCISRGAGDLNEALRFYVGATQPAADGGYVQRVLSEQVHLRAVADGRTVPTNAPMLLQVVDKTPASAAAAGPASAPLPPPDAAAPTLSALPAQVALLH